MWTARSSGRTDEGGGDDPGGGGGGPGPRVPEHYRQRWEESLRERIRV